MNIREFSYNLQKLHEEITDTFSSFQSSTGWNCLSSCGRCCITPDIEVAPLEMIPMALAIYDEGKLDEWIEKITSTDKSSCIALIPGQNEGEGKCGRYKERPGLCRMFGVSGFLDKNNQVNLSICKFIKAHYVTTNIPEKINQNEIPIMTNWSSKISTLDHGLGQKKLPINLALLVALEKVAFYMQYQQSDSLR